MGSFSLVHWLVLGFVLLVIFGPNRLAASGKGLGAGIRSFRRAFSELEDKPARSDEPDRNDALESDDALPPPPKKRVRTPKALDANEIDDDPTG